VTPARVVVARRTLLITLILPPGVPRIFWSRPALAQRHFLDAPTAKVLAPTRS
jgi:hypothetical protein